MWGWAVPSTTRPIRVDEYQIVVAEAVELGTASGDEHIVADLHREVA